MKKTIIISLVFLVFVVLAATRMYFASTENTKTISLYIYPETTYAELCKQIKDKGILKSITLFNICAKTFGYEKKICTGHYEVSPQMKLIFLINKLKKGQQQPVRLTIGKSRLVSDFAEKISQSLMFSKQDMINELQREKLYDSIFFFVIPNTYEFYWTATPKDFILRMRKESEKFWNNKKGKLLESNLTKNEILVLASIVEEETNEESEKSTIAGVYVNRLNKKMLLQADPTIKYALKNFEIKRIKGEHLQVVSPYNTYKVKGLPPTPVCIPSMFSINAVINYKKHNFLFFCAREDFSGFHNFAETAQQHLTNSNKYHKALNEKGIN
jgi:UPF0755 protein